MRTPSLRNSPEYFIGKAIMRDALRETKSPSYDPDHWDDIGSYIWRLLTPRQRQRVMDAGYHIAPYVPPSDPKSPQFDAERMIGETIALAYVTSSDPALPAAMALLKRHMPNETFLAVSEELDARRAIAGSDEAIPF